MSYWKMGVFAAGLLIVAMLSSLVLGQGTSAPESGPATLPAPSREVQVDEHVNQENVMHVSAAPGPQHRDMSTIQALIIGIVEGTTEYLPVSSTGHIILAQRAMGIGVHDDEAKEAADAFAICVQAGAILAVLGLYFARTKQMALGLIGKDAEGKKLAINVLIAFTITAIIGLAIKKKVDAHLMNLWPITFAWLVGGIAILVVAWRRKKTGGTSSGFEMNDLTPKMAVMIGLCQAVAMWPGTSRSLVTIVAGVVVGMNLAAAVEFSFLLGFVTLTAATAHEGLKHGKVMLSHYGWAPIAVGFLAAWIGAVLAITWMVGYLKKHGMELFGYYRVALAVIVLVLLLSGRLLA